jgi:hypothetical protein
MDRSSQSQNRRKKAEDQANRFLDRFGLVLHAEFLGNDPPPWCRKGDVRAAIHGDHYRIFIMDKGETRQLEYDFWNSCRSKEENYRPANYEILAGLSADLRTDLGFLEDETGDAIRDHQDNISNFFTAEELAELQEIR